MTLTSHIRRVVLAIVLVVVILAFRIGRIDIAVVAVLAIALLQHATAHVKISIEEHSVSIVRYINKNI